MTTKNYDQALADYDKALDLVWSDIFELVNAIKDSKSDSEIASAKEHISWSLIELTNLPCTHQRDNDNKESN